MAKFVASGEVIDHTPSSAVAVGAMVAIGTGLVGIANQAIAANVLGSIQVEGVADVDKATGSGTNFAVGTKLYYNTSTGKVTSSANDGATPPVAYAPVGIVLVQPATTDTVVRVKLSR
jgi:predicted RecA/RadA family phage recombinase